MLWQKANINFTHAKAENYQFDSYLKDFDNSSKARNNRAAIYTHTHYLLRSFYVHQDTNPQPRFSPHRCGP